MNSNPMPRRNIPSLHVSSRDNLNRCSSYNGLCSPHLVASNPNLIHHSVAASPPQHRRLSGQVCQKVKRTDLANTGSTDFELLRGADNITYMVNKCSGQVYTQQWILNPKLVFIPMEQCIPQISTKPLHEEKRSSIVRCFPFSPRSRRAKLMVADDIYQGVSINHSSSLKHNIPLKPLTANVTSGNGTYEFVGQHLLLDPKEFTTDVAKLKGTLITLEKQKGPNGFGFTIIGGSETSRQVFLQISGILHTSKCNSNDNLASEAGDKNDIAVGDIIVMCQNTLMLGASPAEFIALVQSVADGQSLRMTVCRGYALPSLQRHYFTSLNKTTDESQAPVTSAESSLTSASTDRASVILNEKTDCSHYKPPISNASNGQNKLHTSSKEDKICRLGFDPQIVNGSCTEPVQEELKNNELIMKLENIYADMKPPMGHGRVPNRGPIIRFHSKLPPKPTNSKHVFFDAQNEIS